MSQVNESGQPVGDDLEGWEPPPFPEAATLSGVHVTLEPLQLGHASALHPTLGEAGDSLWTYMTIGPFRTESEMRSSFETLIAKADWLPYVILVDGKPAGFLSFLRIDPSGGVIEIGSIVFSPGLQRTTAATEAIYLLLKHAFELGYRRCEWKCDDLNGPSRRAAERLGFRYEGTFQKATHYKGRNRDTAWYAITDDEWPHVERTFTLWLAPENFDAGGRQRQGLSDLRD
ncbi:MAG: GNAT family N-acetyltransferase [Acidimicrobiia bacterium]